MASHVERIRAAGPSTAVDLSETFYNLAISIVSRASFGNKQRNAGGFLTAMKAGVALSSGFKLPDLFPTWRPVLAAVTGMRRTLEDIHRTVDSTLEEVIEERTRARDEKLQATIRSSLSGRGPTDTAADDDDDDENLVDLLIGLQERASSSSGSSSFHLNRNSIKAIIFDMFTAGTGTLASSLDWGMSELMRNQRVMGKLQREVREAFRGQAAVSEADIQAADLPYLKLVIKETLRLHPPVPLLVPRESIDECEIEGYTIPARSRVIVNAWAVGRDPKYWEDADEFKPERFDGDVAADFMGGSYEYIPFGAGRRMCPGISYGLPVLEMAIVQLLYHFDWSLQEGVDEVDMTEAPGLGVRRKSPLLLCATPVVSRETSRVQS